MPRGPRKLAVRFGTASLTHYGGAYLLHPFLSRIGFKEAIARHVRVAQRNNRYSVGEVLLALLYLSFAKTASGSLGDDPCPLGEANTPGDWWPSVQRGPVSIPPAIGPALSSRSAGRRVVVVVSRAGRGWIRPPAVRSDDAGSRLRGPARPCPSPAARSPARLARPCRARDAVVRGDSTRSTRSGCDAGGIRSE